MTAREEIRSSPISIATGNAALTVPLLLGLIVVAGAILRLTGIEKESLWGDEIHTVVTARRSLGFLLSESLGHHPPLYFLLTKLSTGIGGEGEFAVRLPAVLFGIISIPVAFLLAKRVTGTTTALFAALMVGMSPVMIWYSQEARPYISSAVFVLVSAYLLIEFTERPSAWSAISFSIAAFLGLYTHYYFAVFLAVAIAVSAVTLWRQRQAAPLGILAAAGALASIAVLSRIGVLITEIENSSMVATSEPGTVALEFIRAVGLGRFQSDGFIPVLILSWVAVIFGSARILLRPSAPKVMVLATAWGYVAILLAGAVVRDFPIVLRHLVPVLPLWYLLLAFGVVEGATLLANRTAAQRRTLVRSGVLGLVIVGTLAWSVNAWAAETDEITKDQWREIAAAVVAEAEEGDVVYIDPYIHLRHFAFYAGDDMSTFTAELGSRPACADGHRLWMVVSGPREEVKAGLERSCVSAGDETQYMGNIGVALFAPLASSGQLLTVPDCDGLKPTIIGTEGNDPLLRGSDGPDVIHGLGGDDTIAGLDGNDVLCGGAGDDVINAGDGHDRTYSGDGDDTVSAGPGDDLLEGGEGNDKLNGADGVDDLKGEAGADTLNAGSGDDLADGGDGDDTVNGGPGDDELQTGAGNDTINAGSGNDSLRNAAGSDILRGGSGEDSCPASSAGQTVQCETTVPAN